MKKLYNPAKEDWDSVLKRPTETVDNIEGLVKQVFETVIKQGDKAIRTYTEKFDGTTINDSRVGAKEFLEAEKLVSPALKQAIALARNNIERFHTAQKTSRVAVETTTGVNCWQEKRPIQKVGLYIPGGTAPLFSTILMLAIPAKIAGCEEVILCSPPNAEGKIHPAILYTAQVCGLKQIYKVGGIQAIAGMTFGTETIPGVQKIFGPGNQYVTVAKQIATNYGIAIDMPAGPSELLVMADKTGNPAFIASDLLSQAEHGVDSQVILVTTSEKILIAVEKEVQEQLLKLPRKEIARKAIENSKLIYIEKNQDALDLINAYAPEHLIICCEDEAFFVNQIRNAGSVFIGDYTPESAGDYASGTNHTLPTNGFARQYSGVNLDSFLKSITFQKISREGIQQIGPAIETMAEAEGLMAHKNAVSIRLKELK